MRNVFFSFLSAFALIFSYTACDNPTFSPEEKLSADWLAVPDKEIANIKQWYTETQQSSSSARINPSDPIMWGTAKYSRVKSDSYLMTAYVADTSTTGLKRIYVHKSDYGYSGYILGYQPNEEYRKNHSLAMEGDFSGEITIYDLDGNIQTSSVLENGKSVRTKNGQTISGSNLSNMRVSGIEDINVLPEVVITGTRNDGYNTWLLMTTGPTYYDLSSVFPGAQYIGYTNGGYQYQSLVPYNEPFAYGDGPVVDISKVVDCFRIQNGKTPNRYGVTIYVDQPKAGTREKWAVSNNTDKDLSAGHTFVKLTQYYTDGTMMEHIVGFYPINNNVNPLFGDDTDAGGYRNDNGGNYDVSITFNNVTGSQFTNVLTYLYLNDSNPYNLQTYNCTDAGLGCAKSMGYTLPDTQGSWATGKGSNPADLGEDLRAMPKTTGYTINKASGVANTNYRPGPSGC